MIIRRLSPSKLKRLLLLSHSQSAHTHIQPLSNSIPSTFNPHFHNPPKTLPPNLTFFKPFSSHLTRDGNYDESTSQTLHICPGCGVQMQHTNPKQPGFFIKPIPKNPNYKTPIHKTPIADESEISDSLKRGFIIEQNEENPQTPNSKSEVLKPETQNPKTEVSKSVGKNPETQNSKKEIEENPETRNPKPVVCARCHALRHYGRVRDPTVENLLPDFDFDHTVGKRFGSVSGARTVVMMVVDAADFDGSFPKAAARLVSRTIDENYSSWKKGKSGNVPRVVLVVTKIDLLPSSISPTGFEHWVRARAREGGANKLTSVHLVSSVKDWGLKNLVDEISSLAGPRGHVWAIGAQNAGKSTLINAIGKCVGGNVSHLTEAPVPGTTLGIIRVEGVLSGQAKLFDTPGLLHPHQISTRLTREEHKLVQISKELKPRTYRIKAGHSVHIGGLMRLDIEESSADSIYVTVWASPYLPLHMGKTENACTMLEDHFGRQLQPPIGEARVEELGNWVKKEFRVSGNWWDSSCVDIAAAGLGWFAIGLKGEALLGVWTYDGVDVVLRNALIPHRSHTFEVAGFTVSQIVSKADKASNKRQKNVKKNKLKDSTTAAPASSSLLAVDEVKDSTTAAPASSSLLTVDVMKDSTTTAASSSLLTVDEGPNS